MFSGPGHVDDGWEDHEVIDAHATITHMYYFCQLYTHNLAIARFESRNAVDVSPPTLPGLQRHIQCQRRR